MNLRRSLAVPLVLLPAVAVAADSSQAKQPVSEPGGISAIEQQLRQNPDDLALWNRYLRTSFWPLMPLVNSNPDEAQKRVAAMRQFVDSLQPTQDGAKQMLAGTKRMLDLWEQGIQVARTSRPELETRLKANPNDAPTLSLYARKVRIEIWPLIYFANDLAAQKLTMAKTFLAEVRARAEKERTREAFEEADQVLTRLQGHIDAAKTAARLARTPRAELEAKLKTNPDDRVSIAMYAQRLSTELVQLASSDPARAEQGLDSAKAFLDDLRLKVKDDAARESLKVVTWTLSRLQHAIDRGKQRAALVGKDAAPLEVEAWVNGTPLTAADLKGKVVLLDFWAVWFGPCLAALPRLREWHEKYADQGLVIIGLTRYFNYVWDEKTSRPMRAQGQEKVAAEKEREMLVKFAEHHKLRYRFAIQKDDALAKYYAFHLIPHVVLIDREGKVRLIREDDRYNGEKNARDIQEMIEKLIANSD